MTEQPNESEFVQDESEDRHVPDLKDLDDNEPEEGVEYVAVESQDLADTENPDQNKHEE